MTDTDRLRDLLEQAAPTQPRLDPTARAALVASRGRAARTRDRVLVAASAVAVVAVVAAVPLMLGGNEPSDVATSPPPVTAPPCPAQPIDVESLAPVPALDDVVAVRSCPTAQDLPAAPNELPTTPLAGAAAAAFGADVNALPAYVSTETCNMAFVVAPPWALVVTTADGGTQVLGSSMIVCVPVSVDGTERGAEDILAAFKGNLSRQQSGGPEALACPTGDRLADGADTWNASFDPATATAGRVCYRADPMGANADYVPAKLLDDDQLAAIRTDLAANLRPRADNGMCTDTGPQRLLMLEDAAGDQAAWVDDRCEGTFVGARGTWLPGSDVDRMINVALGLFITQ